MISNPQVADSSEKLPGPVEKERKKKKKKKKGIKRRIIVKLNIMSGAR